MAFEFVSLASTTGLQDFCSCIGHRTNTDKHGQEERKSVEVREVRCQRFFPRPGTFLARLPIRAGGLPIGTGGLPIGMVVGEVSKLCDKSTDAKLGSFTHYAAKLKVPSARRDFVPQPGCDLGCDLGCG